MKINWKYFFTFFILIAILGYYREKLFVTLNHLMYIKYYHTDTEKPLDSFILFLDGFSYETLYYMKYPLTILSILVFAYLNYLFVKLSLNNNKISKLLIYSFGILITLAALSMAFGYIVNHRLQNDEYTLSRWLLGIAQSPIIAIVLIASSQLLNKQKN